MFSSNWYECPVQPNQIAERRNKHILFDCKPMYLIADAYLMPPLPLVSSKREIKYRLKPKEKYF